MSQPSTWRLGVVIPLGGSAGIFGPSCQATAELAMDELNRSTGVLGRRVEVQFLDGSQAPGAVSREVSTLLDTGQLDALTGWHISSVRNAIVPAVSGRLPYVYTSLYEGGETRAGVYCSGEVPSFQIVPALKWLAQHLGKRRWFIVGHDYVWPTQTASVLTDACARMGIEIIGQAFVRMDAGHVDLLVEEVSRHDGDGVLMLLVGQEAAEFNRLFSERNLHHRMTRYSPLMEETMVLASGPEATENLFVSAGFFRDLITAGSFDLQSRYAALHGAGAPPLNNVAESCYEGIFTLAHLARLADSFRVEDMNRVVGNLGYDGPRGTVQFHGTQAVYPVHLAEIQGLDFNIIDRL